MLVVVSNARALRRRYGADGLTAIRTALDRFTDRSRLPARVRFVDQSKGESLGVDPSSGMALRVALRSLVRAEPGVSGLVLLGGDDVLPFYRLPNPVADRTADPDPEVLSDNPYGLGPNDALADEVDGLLRPSIPVGRLPDADPPRLEAFLEKIDGLSQAASHDRSGTFAAVDEAWQEVPARVLGGTASTLRVSPGWHTGDAEWSGLRPQLSYFNLHGFDDRPGWFAYDARRSRWTIAVRPGDISRTESCGSVVFAENCYGAFIGRRSAGNSVALAFLAAGARAFVGATGTAFSSIGPGLEAVLLRNADLMAKEFLGNVGRRRMAFGAALVEARRAFVDRSLSIGRTTFGLKTALQFVLYGNPMAVL